jgi:hypothetical protein
MLAARVGRLAALGVTIWLCHNENARRMEPALQFI